MSEKREMWEVRADDFETLVVIRGESVALFEGIAECQTIQRAEQIVHMHNTYGDLLAAAKIVLAGLNARIEAAPDTAVPIFNGIADLHAAIAAAEGSQSTTQDGSAVTE